MDNQLLLFKNDHLDFDEYINLLRCSIMSFLEINLLKLVY